MKKKIALFVTFILAFAVSLAVFAGCGEEVTVEGLRDKLSLTVGQTSNLGGATTASDGSELVWTSSDETVATVDAGGKVEAKAAGTTDITATVKGTKISATCTVTVKAPVTVTFKNAAGANVTNIQIDRNGGPVQLTATASDGSNITTWNSADEKIATVSNDGVVTGIREGKVEITARSSTGSGTIEVTVIDSIEGEHYQLTTDDTLIDEWFYFIREDGGRNCTINQAELREGKVIVDVTGDWNWGADNMYVKLVKSGLEYEGHWYGVTMTINSSIATTLTVHDTRVDLKQGDNVVTVYYQQWNESVIIWFGNGEAGTQPNTIRLEISDVSWDGTFQPVNLKTPGLALEGEQLTITDNENTKGVHNYEIGLFEEKDGNEVLVFNQPVRGTSGTLDTSSAKKNGTFTVKIRAIGNTGFNDSPWSEAVGSYTVTNADAPYKLTQGNDPQKKGGGAAAALTSGRWEYLITDSAEGVVYKDAYYEDGTVTFEGTNGWAADSAQLLRHYAEYAAGTELTVTMTLTLSEASGEAAAGGKIRVCGQVVDMKVGVPQTVTVNVTQKNGAPTIEILLGVVAEDDAEWPGKKMASDSLHYGPIKFSVADVTVAPKA